MIELTFVERTTGRILSTSLVKEERNVPVDPPMVLVLPGHYSPNEEYYDLVEEVVKPRVMLLPDVPRDQVVSVGDTLVLAPLPLGTKAYVTGFPETIVNDGELSIQFHSVGRYEINLQHASCLPFTLLARCL